MCIAALIIGSLLKLKHACRCQYGVSLLKLSCYAGGDAASVQGTEINGLASSVLSWEAGWLMHFFLYFYALFCFNNAKYIGSPEKKEPEPMNSLQQIKQIPLSVCIFKKETGGAWGWGGV